VLNEDDPAASLPTVLSWSCDALDDERARAFELLGIAPGPDIGLPAAAAVCDLPVGRVHDLLDDLARASLLTEHVPGRYRMHDLVRLFAVQRAADDLPEGLRTGGLRRLTDFYLHTACVGDRLVFPHRRPIVPTRLTDEHLGLPLRGNEDSVAWFDAEHANLLAVQQHAVDRGWDSAVWQLAWATTTIHYRRGHVQASLDAWRTGLRAAERLGDDFARALAHRHIGDAYTRSSRHAEALDELGHALALAEEAGDVRNAARCHYDLCSLRGRLGEDEKALEHAYAALSRFRGLDLPVWVAAATNLASWYESRLGRHERARDLGEVALALFRDVDNRDGIAHALDNLGRLAHQDGRHHDAVAYYEEARTVSLEVGHAYLEADVLDHLATTYADLGLHDQARDAWHDAYTRYRAQHRTAGTERARRRLHELGSLPGPEDDHPATVV
jgi:tetratricopeptide (TPR) repeat protein